uniref:Uncharacterized protein n=1 Tax=Ixodes ricinus TaxID=34613 RepID=A0A6B0UXU0_IXORI
MGPTTTPLKTSCRNPSRLAWTTGLLPPAAEASEPSCAWVPPACVDQERATLTRHLPERVCANLAYLSLALNPLDCRREVQCFYNKLGRQESKFLIQGSPRQLGLPPLPLGARTRAKFCGRCCGPSQAAGCGPPTVKAGCLTVFLIIERPTNAPAWAERWLAMRE